MYFKFFLFVSLVFVGGLSFADDSRFQQDVERMISAIENDVVWNYAPHSLKHELFDWELTAQIMALREKALKPGNTLEDVQIAVHDFFSSMRDYHVSSYFYSTESARLPFRVRRFGNDFIVVALSPSWPSWPAGFEVGAKLLAMDGQPVEEVIQSLLPPYENVSATDHRFAQFFLTVRSKQMNPRLEIPLGAVQITYEDMTGKVRETEIAWNYQEETFVSPPWAKIPHSEEPRLPNAFHDLNKEDFTASFLDRKLFTQKSHLSFLNRMMVAGPPELFNSQIENWGFGETKSSLPSYGNVIWTYPNDELFDARIFQDPKSMKLYGFLRIPSYMPQALPGDAIQSLREILGHMENSTEGLIIDQLSNPGGGLFYLYSIVSLFADVPASIPAHLETLSFEKYTQAKDLLQAPLPESMSSEQASMTGYSFTAFDYFQIQEYSRRIVRDWERGEKVTGPGPLLLNKINPDSLVTYTKPVTILIDEICLSGGDFFPAIMQDNKRAKIFGTPTAGAGGYVTSRLITNPIGLAGYSLTGSLALRPGTKGPIENYGVTPDIYYEFTSEDYYESFQSFYEKVIESLHSFSMQ